MCGIAGAVNFRLPHQIIDDTMGHRGPDARAGFSVDNVDLYHLRLSIVDIINGAQPMHLHERYTIIFNGEIYNHAELKRQFGITAVTHSDTEVLLHLYDKAGAEMLQHLDGMFVFAIYDRREKKIFIARDRAGKKPVYIFNDGKKIVFASELNCLAGMVIPEINISNFYHYLRLGTFYGKLTPYKNVEELPGGAYLEIDCRSLSIREKKWWSIADFYLKPNRDSLQDSLQKVESYLDDGVKSRIDSSDLEVGCFLSGGIDSGLVTALASKYTGRLKTFTVSFAGEYDEAPLAALVANKYQTDHTEINISFDHLKDDVENILGNYGEPFFDSSAIPSYYVSREAKKNLTVILNGDGADELFGGYRRYVPFARYDFFRNNLVTRKAAGMINTLLPAPDNKKTKYNYLYRLSSLAAKSDLEMYLSAGVDIIEGFENNLTDPGFDYLEPIRQDFKRVAETRMSGLQKIMCLDFDGNLFNDLLVKMDIATMVNSLEGRSPFLCKQLLEYVPGMADGLKIRGTSTKYLLRELAKKLLPAELINQPKRGFEIPLKDWVDNELNELIMETLHPANAFISQFFKKGFVQKVLSRNSGMPAEKRAKLIWTLFAMEVWHKKYLRLKSPVELKTV